MIRITDSAFLIYPYKHKYVSDKGLQLLKKSPAVITLGVNIKLTLPPK